MSELWIEREDGKEMVVPDVPDINVGNMDAVSRQAAINEIDEWIREFKVFGHNESASDLRFVRTCIEKLPSAQPERKTGKWVHVKNPEHMDLDYDFVCSECGYEIFDWKRITKFCPNCGSQMEGGAE